MGRFAQKTPRVTVDFRKLSCLVSLTRPHLLRCGLKIAGTSVIPSRPSRSAVYGRILLSSDLNCVLSGAPLWNVCWNNQCCSY